MSALARSNTASIAPRAHPGLKEARHAGRALRISPRGLCDMSPWSQIVLLCQQMLGRRMIFHAPDDAEQSFDERWLLAILNAVRSADADSYRFLLMSRMSPEKASALHFPLCRLAGDLDTSAQ